MTEYHPVKEREIDKSTKELLALVISKINEEDECLACTPCHRAAAKFEGGSDPDISILENYEAEKEKLPDIKRDIIDFGIKSAFFPKQINTSLLLPFRRIQKEVGEGQNFRFPCETSCLYRSSYGRRYPNYQAYEKGYI